MPAADRAQVMWRMKLHSAIRTTLACSIVGCITLYGPSCFRETITFPAFSYVTAILVVSDANLGDAIRGCCHAFYATLQVLPFTMLSLRIIPHDSFSRPGTAALMVALASFLVGLPKSTPLLAKRIAFGQIVIVYVDIFIHGNRSKSNGIMLPLHVASSTALGALSSFLALLLPYPRLAYSEVRRLSWLYAQNASERLNLCLKGLTAESNLVAVELSYQAKPLADAGNKLLHNITLMQEGVLWERPWLICLKTAYQNPAERLVGVETLVRGMEIALGFCNLPAGLANQELNHTLTGVLSKLGIGLDQARCFSSLNFNSITVPELNGEFVEKLIFPDETIHTVDNDKWACFFISCMQQFINDFTMRETLLHSYMQKREKLEQLQDPGLISMKERYVNWIMKLIEKRLLFSLKCSLSLGLAVLIGMTFKIEQAYWSGLTIAISFVEGRQATFTAANARVLGTAVGSVYGVLGCFIFKKLVNIRFLILLPWIIFTSFLRHSKMYGQAGGITAVIGALLILGRKNYGPPQEFAIARLTEAVIGLCSFTLIELLLQPTRASSLARKHLYLSLETLQECIKNTVFPPNWNDQSPMRFQEFSSQQRNLKSHVHDLQSSVEEAESEPNYWFLPFHGPCYRKLQGSLSNTAVLLSCMTHSLQFLLPGSQNDIPCWKELKEHIDNNLELCNDILSTSLRSLETSTLAKSLQVGQELQVQKISHDLETGNSPAQNILTSSNVQNDKRDSIAIPFHRQSGSIEDNTRDVEGGEELNRKMILHLSAFGFCTGCLVREMKDIESSIKELMYWENP